MTATLAPQDITSERRCYHCRAAIGAFSLATMRDEAGTRHVVWTCTFEHSPAPVLTPDQAARLDAIFDREHHAPLSGGWKRITEYVAG